MIASLQKSLYLAAGQRRWPWLLVIVLALTVSLVEATGAILVFGLLNLITSPNEPIEVPVVGDVTRFLPDGPRDVILIGAILVAAFFLLRAFIVVGMAYVQARVTQSAGARLASRLQRGYLSMPYVIYVGSNSSRQIRNIHVTVPGVVADVFVQGTTAISAAIIVVVLSLILLVASPLAMGILVLVIVPGILGVNRFVRPRLHSLGRDAQDIAASSLQILQESLQGLREIRAYRREEHFASLFASTTYALAQSKSQRTFLKSLPGTAAETALVIFISAFLVITTASGLDASAAIPTLGMFAYVGFRLKPSINQVLEGINSFRYSAPAVQDLYEDLQKAEAWAEPVDPPATPINLERSIRLEEVTFRYPGASQAAIENIDLEIERGTSVGIVGTTGSGKSTLVDLIIGLLQPDEGSVLVDGLDIRTGMTTWLECLGVVPQLPFLLDATIRGNITLDAPDSGIDNDQLTKAITLAQLGDLINDLPDGLDTNLGEHGVRLSGGQRQRIAIARALYSDPDVLILDEGTAALDNQTEAALMDALESLRGKCTFLMVAHRLSTIQHCDVIHVVEKGRLVASGSFKDLTRKSTHFKDLQT